MLQFLVTNNTASPIIFTTLDDYELAIGAVDVDLYAAPQGDFEFSDILDNSEIQALIDSGDITAKDETGDVVNSVSPSFSALTDKVRISETDTTKGYIDTEIVGTTGKIEGTVINPGADEKLQFNIGADVFDKTSDTLDNVTQGTTNLHFTATDNTKLDNIEANAQVNVKSDWNAGTGDAEILNKPSLDFVPNSEKGSANGVATLDGSGQVPASQLPSYVDDVLEYANLAAFPATGEAGKIYVTLDDNKIYRWTGSTYVEVSPGAGAPVSSVNTQTGAVVLDADDISDASTTNKFVTSADLTTLSNTSGTNSGDEVDATTTVKGIVELATDGENAANVVVQGNDSRLSDARTPLSHTHTLSDVTDSGTAAALNVPVSGDAAAGEVVKGNDSRLTDSRTPTSHTHTASEITDFDTEVGNNTDVAANTSARHDAVTLGGVANDTTDDTLDLTGQSLTVNLATVTTDGVMSASDKSKLDGIATGAEVNAVDSVNSQTGAVSLDADDIDDTSTSHKFVTASDLTTLSNTSGTNTGDEVTFTGAGTEGVVPDPTTSTGKFLKDDGTWASVGGGGDLISTNNLSDVANASTSLSNLGGEPSFTKNTGFNKNLGTSAGTVSEGNHTHDWDDATGTADSIPFNIALTKPTHAEGLFYYDKDEHAMVVYNDEVDVTQQIGREFYRRVRNESGATILNGKVVYQSGAETGGEGRALIDLAQANDPVKENVIGVATHDIENNTYGYVTVLGDVNDVNTSGYTAGEILYLSPTVAGELTDVLPDADEFVVEVATVELVNATTGRLNVGIKNRGRLTDFGIISSISGWNSGLDVTEANPTPNGTVDYTSGDYYHDGTLYTIGSGGNYDLSALYLTTLLDGEKAYVAIHVDESGVIESSLGTRVSSSSSVEFAPVPVGDVCIAQVLIHRSSGTLQAIKNDRISDCRNATDPNQIDEFVKISFNDTNKKYLEDALDNSGNVQFSVLNEGANETIKGDVDLSGKADVSHTHTASDVTDFDTEVSNNTSVAANTAKVTNATHTGEVTGSGALSLDKTAVTNKTTVTGESGDFILISDTSDSGNLKKMDVADVLGGGGSNIIVQKDDATVGTVTDTLNFEGGGVSTAVDEGANKTTVTIAAPTQHDRQQVFSSTLVSTTSSIYNDVGSMTLTTGNLGGTGEYMVTFNADVTTSIRGNDNHYFILNINGVDITNSEKRFTLGRDAENDYHNFTLTWLASGVAAGQIIKIRFKESSGGQLSVTNRNLIIDGVLDSNTI